jgi:bifunctional non-homologous end joining protein LigD
VLVHVGDPMLATNRDGQATSVHPAVLDAAGNLPLGTVIDGEVVGGAGGPTYWVFDVLSIGDEDVRGLGYLARWTRIDEDLEAGFTGPLRLLECAHGKAKKKALHDRLRKAGCEGVVFKQRDAPYAAGRGTTQLKHKFVKSADVVLIENAGNAYRMAVYAGKVLTPVGKVFSGTTSATRAEIDALLAAGKKPVAEVRRRSARRTAACGAARTSAGRAARARRRGPSARTPTRRRRTRARSRSSARGRRRPRPSPARRARRR